MQPSALFYSQSHLAAFLLVKYRNHDWTPSWIPKIRDAPSMHSAHVLYVWFFTGLGALIGYFPGASSSYFLGAFRGRFLGASRGYFLGAFRGRFLGASRGYLLQASLHSRTLMQCWTFDRYFKLCTFAGRSA